MSTLEQIFAWIAANPGEAAWLLVGLLTFAVALYHRLRPTIKAYVDRTTVSWDNELVASLDRFFSRVDWVIGLLEVLLPALASRGRRGAPGEPPPPPAGGAR